MGDKITRPTVSADHVRVRFLREALHNNAAALSAPGSGTAIVSGSSHLDPESAELQGAYLEQLVECAPEAISILDTEMRITRLNGEFTRVFGFRPEEALGRTLEELIVPPDRSSETRWIQEELAKGKKVVLETKRQRKDGSLVDVLISSAPVVVTGEHVGVCALYRDISEQKRAEALSAALLRIAEKASSPDDLQQFYGAMHNIVAELMYARNFYVALYDAETQSWWFSYFLVVLVPRPTPKKLGKWL
jgi:PAS domain S-box-containing protein